MWHRLRQAGESLSTALNIAKLLVYCALILLLGEAAYSLHYARQRSVYTFDKLNAVLRKSDQTMDELRKGITTWQKASEAQAEESTAVLSETHKTLAQIRSSVDGLAASLTTSISAFNADIDQQSRSLLETQKNLRENLSQMQQATIQLQATLADADRVIADPSIKVSLDNIAASSQNAATATANLATTTKDVEVVAQKFKDDFVKPKNRALAYLKAILGLGSEGRILFSH